MSTTRAPRLNHVAMSLPPDALDEAGRADIVRFYGEVFGFEEYPMLTEDRRRLVLRVHTNEQFVFLVAGEPPMTAPRMDHFGLSVGTKEEFDDLWKLVRERADADAEVDVIDPHVDDYGMLKLHSFYVGYRLPLMVEIQHYEYTAADT
jgi:hypothetical protein